MGYVYFDTETTGLSPGQIGELSIIVENNGQITLAKNYFFKVDSMQPDAEKTHGFSIEDFERLSEGKTFADYKDELADIFNNNGLVAHNLPFDEKFLSSEFWNCRTHFKPIERNDTMVYFKNVLKIPAKSRRFGPYKNPRLSEVVDALGIDMSKVQALCDNLFGAGENIGYHDSRLDTTAMFVAVNVQREKLHGGTAWRDAYCK